MDGKHDIGRFLTAALAACTVAATFAWGTGALLAGLALAATVQPFSLGVERRRRARPGLAAVWPRPSGS